jgi:hypothetical protein
MLNVARLAMESNGANQFIEFGDPNTRAEFVALYEWMRIFMFALALRIRRS